MAAKWVTYAQILKWARRSWKQLCVAVGFVAAIATIRMCYVEEKRSSAPPQSPSLVASSPVPSTPAPPPAPADDRGGNVDIQVAGTLKSEESPIITGGGELHEKAHDLIERKSPKNTSKSK